MTGGRAAAALLGLLLTAGPKGWADEVRSEKSQFKTGREVPRKAPRGRKAWEVELSAGILHDDNIRHLLVNSPIDSGIPLPDDIVRMAAGATLDPRFGRLKTEFSYAYQRDDFQKHPAFSYHNHSLEAALYPPLAERLSLEAGAALDWTGDQTGAISNDQTGRLGLVWSGLDGLRLKAGYERRRDSVLVNSLKNAHSDILYLKLHGRFLKTQTGFASYRYRRNSAGGSDFSYRSHSASFGVISHWTRSFKTTWLASYIRKDYDNLDSRFLQMRRDATYSATVRPALALWPGLDAVAGAAYLKNRSNVSLKSYTDRIYSFSLEARF